MEVMVGDLSFETLSGLLAVDGVLVLSLGAVVVEVA
jgi:hypothetical protein